LKTLQNELESVKKEVYELGKEIGALKRMLREKTVSPA
jgi:hypothetical protein